MIQLRKRLSRVFVALTREVLWRAGDSRSDPKWPAASAAKREAVNCNTQPVLNRRHISQQVGTCWRTFSALGGVTLSDDFFRPAPSTGPNVFRGCPRKGGRALRGFGLRCRSYAYSIDCAFTEA